MADVQIGSVFMCPIDGGFVRVKPVEIGKSLLVPLVEKKPRAASDIQNLAAQFDPILDEIVGDVEVA